MGRLLFAIFLIVPIIEIGIFIIVGQLIGLWPTLLGVVATALIGSYIIRMQGFSLISEIRRLTAAGALPARQIADGVMLAIAGALLLTPGYFTDFLGFLLLVPTLRTIIYEALKKRIHLVAGFDGASSFTTGNQNGQERGPSQPNSDYVDLDDDSWREK